jgi:rhamnogalacturonan endolyase
VKGAGMNPGRRQVRSRRLRGAVLEPLDARRLLAGDPGIAGSASVQSGLIQPPRQVERLDRGVVSVRTGATTAFVSWRLMGDDPSSIAFNLYRVTGTGSAFKRNTTPITNSTNFADTGVSSTLATQYFVRSVVNGVEGTESPRFTLAAGTVARPYLSVPIQPPVGGTTPDGVSYTYSANDGSVGDLDGDGQYDIVLKWDPSNAKDNSHSGHTGNVFIDAYQLDGTRLWRVDLGRNIRAGAHYTQFQVYDYDGDGKAELGVKTAPGTIDGQGNAVLMGSDSPNADYRNADGYILSGPEYLTMFNGLTGAAMSTVAYDPPRGITTNNPTPTQLNSLWGDNYGNRVDRFLAATAYLDGERPSLVVSRGYYTRAVVAAYDFRNGQLVQRWKFDTDDGTGHTGWRGQGSHSLSVGDVDGDGRDEILFGAAAINDNGRGLYNTTLGHGDATHMGDMVPSRAGQEVFMSHESSGSYNKNGIDAGGDLRDAMTGELLGWVPGGTADVGRGNAFDIDPRYAGNEYWTSANDSIWAYDPSLTEANKLVPIQGKPSNMFQNFAIQWDADPLFELLDGTTIGDWRLLSGTYGRQNYDLDPNSSNSWPPDAASNNTTKGTPVLAADVLGDWRDEVIWRSTDSTQLFIYTTTLATTLRMYTPMHDIQYRTAIAWQNTAYNQPAHTSYFRGQGMAAPPTPNTFYAGEPTGEAALLDVYQAEDATAGGGAFDESTNARFNGAAYVNFPQNGGTLEWADLDIGGGGAATLRFRYALGGTTARTGQLIVNGIAQDITFAPTGGFSSWQTMSIPLTLGAYESLTVRLASTGQDLANIDELQVRRLADTIAPGGAASYVYAASPHQIVVDFDEPILSTLSPASLQVWRAGNPASSMMPTAVVYDAVARRATFTLPALSNGNYQVRLAASAAADASGNVLADDVLLEFFVLTGDIDRNRTVDFNDLLVLAQNYSQNNRTYAEGDLNGDGTVDFNDLLLLAQNYNTGLALQAGKTATPPASRATAFNLGVSRR